MIHFPFGISVSLLFNSAYSVHCICVLSRLFCIFFYIFNHLNIFYIIFEITLLSLSLRIVILLDKSTLSYGELLLYAVYIFVAVLILSRRLYL